VGGHCHTPETVKIPLREHTPRLEVYLRLLWSAEALISDENSLVQDCTDPDSVYQVTRNIRVGVKSAVKWGNLRK